MKGARKFTDYLNEQMKQEKFKDAFEEEEVFANLAIEIANLRQNRGLTQKDLAEVLDTTQQTISRLEDPHNKSLSLNTLIKLAEVFHKKLKIRFS